MPRPQYHQPHNAKRQRKAKKPVQEGSNDAVLQFDIAALRRQFWSERLDPELEPADHDSTSDVSHLPERFSEIDVHIRELSSTGDGLGYSDLKDHIYVVPFTVPGDRVKAKAVQHFPDAHYSLADFIEVIKAGPQRDDSLVRCKYFAKCGGCQIQMLSYGDQLKHKKSIIEKAYQNFSGLVPEAVPAVGDTIGSPLQYGYRTKLTPHFDGPPGSMSRKARRNGERMKFENVPPIGFMSKGSRKTLDIEDCPIGTDAVREGLKAERKRVTDEIGNYRKGATLLLRESTERVSKDTRAKSLKENVDDEAIDGQNTPGPAFTDSKTCITDQKATAVEYIDDHVFKNTAGAFFQNNNSILPTFTAYIRSHILPSIPLPSPPPAQSSTQTPISYLLDAYSGSGLFTITLSRLFERSLGIDISPACITSATLNAESNNIPPTQAAFKAADAADIFADVNFQPDETVVVVDPPRKGCDKNFLVQLLKFGPQRVCYVSCNVHTQARDVGILVEGVAAKKGVNDGKTTGAPEKGVSESAKGEARGGAYAVEETKENVNLQGHRKDGNDKDGREDSKAARTVRYEIESVQGFDFFPQTGHVESVAILRRV